MVVTAVSATLEYIILYYEFKVLIKKKKEKQQPRDSSDVDIQNFKLSHIFTNKPKHIVMEKNRDWKSEELI